MIDLQDEAATVALGAALSAAVGADRAVLLLEGTLGAGKTALARGFLRARGELGPVASPTYAIVHTYPASGVSHADVYRVTTEAELEQTGILDGVEHGIWLIEWASQFPGVWPEDRLEITLAVNGETRAASITATGPASSAVLARLECA